MSWRLNDIDLNSDAQNDELNDIDKFESEAVNQGISDAQTLADQPIGNNEEDKIRLDISDKITVRNPELGHSGRDNDGVMFGDTATDHEIEESVESDLKMKAILMENEAGFHVNDLVWAKVRSHPWWPGQIFNHFDASDKAKKHQNSEDQLLIGFFGDQSFAWNEESQVKPFYTNFTQMEKQSDLGSFHHAVDCSLDEVSRRVQFGLSCKCSPEELSHKIRTQIVVNAGIREESSRIEGKEDNHSSINSFVPSKLIQYARELAESPHKTIDTLDFVIAHSQLLAFNCWKGYYELPEFKTFRGLLDNDEFVHGSSSRKRKGKFHSDVRQPKKEKLISDLMSENCSNSSKMKIEKTNKSPAYKKKSPAYLVASSDSLPKSKTTKIACPEEMLSQVRLAAEDPINSIKAAESFLEFFSDFRNSFCMERSSDWIIKTKDDDEDETLLFNPKTPTNPEVQCEQQQHSPTALILNFTDLSSVPPVSNLNKIFSRFGPLDESETEVMKKSKRAKVIFKRRNDAETAFSSAGKFSIFGPALVSYRLTPQKSIPAKRSKRVAA